MCVCACVSVANIMQRTLIIILGINLDLASWDMVNTYQSLAHKLLNTCAPCVDEGVTQGKVESDWLRRNL